MSGGRTRFEANVCVLLHRDGRWLLAVRSPDLAYAAGQLGLIGGHIEPVPGPDILESTARREVLEETGLDLTGLPLRYLSSALYVTDDRPVLTVTFVGELPPGQEPLLAAPDELTAVGWWSLGELSVAPDCAPWVLPLVTAAERLVVGS